MHLNGAQISSPMKEAHNFQSFTTMMISDNAHPSTVSYVRSSPARRPMSECSSSVTSSPMRSASQTMNMKEPKSSTMRFSLTQVVIYVALGSSIAALSTALVSSYSISKGRYLVSSTQQWENLPQQLRLRTQGGKGETVDDPPLTIVFPSTDALSQTAQEDSTQPDVAWLMSFPNSGTSFTIHMAREASNCTTATNYGLEGEIKDKPSEQAISGSAGVHGPWLELIPGRSTRIPQTVLTKTHCKGFCSGRYCGPEKTFHTPRSFMMACLTGNKAVERNGKIKLIDTTYDSKFVKKAIHVFRHPLDNVVARFHLLYNEQEAAGGRKFTDEFPKNATGFQKWCAIDDRNTGLLKSKWFVDNRLRGLMRKIPCFNEFFRYVQWHNLAFDTTDGMNVETMVLHYDEYSENLAKARDRVLRFLELPLVGESIPFHKGKVYLDYYSRTQKNDIWAFLKEFATAQTWMQLRRYEPNSTGASA